MPALGKILVVDDDAGARLLATQALIAVGYDVAEARSGAEALALISVEAPALVVLDVSMPEMDGFAVVAELRRRGFDRPVLMLTAYADMDRRVQGLTVGADDYLVKPFDGRELGARIHALLRRARPPAAGPSAGRILRFATTEVNLDTKVAKGRDGPVALTRTEFAILDVLAAKEGKPVSREALLKAVWGYEAEANTRTLETHVWRLRKKLGDDHEDTQRIKTRSGLGYMLKEEAGTG